MSIQIKEPVLIVGLGGVGSRLALETKDVLNTDCLLISNDDRDLVTDSSIHVSTKGVINPSISMIRGVAYDNSNVIRTKISHYGTVIMMGNLAGRAGAAIAPIVSAICKETSTSLISFVVMPFRYEKNRIFSSGLALKHVRNNSMFTILLDNDSLLECNPSLTPNECYKIGNAAIKHVVKSLALSDIHESMGIVTTSKGGQQIEESLRDSLKMLYANTSPKTVKQSILYMTGNIPVGTIDMVSEMTQGIVGNTVAQIDVTSDESNVVMLSTTSEMTKFDRYDPLNIIPQEKCVEESMPECSINLNIDLYQME